MRVTVGIPTRDRYQSLVLTLEALAFQTHRDFKVVVIDDTDEPQRIDQWPNYQAVFTLLHEKGIEVWIEQGQKKGQHYSHQRIQDMADTDWIWRLDDDQIPEPRVLEILLSHVGEDVGAVGGLVLNPQSREAPDKIASLISNPDANVQWHKHSTIKTFDVEHLHATFLYRKGIEKYNLFLSPAAHREETLFSYGLKRQGYKLIVDTGAVTWHFPGSTGGIRSHTQHPEYWQQDEKLFWQQLNEWGVNGAPIKYVVLDAGRGDHVIVKKLLPRLKEKYKPSLTLATCYPDIFNGEVPQISIAEAQQRLGNLDRYNIYRWCQEHNFRGDLTQAYEKLYEL